MKTRTSSLFLVALAAASCGSFRDPGDLHYPRVLAVRAEPPRVPAEQRARIDLLITGTNGVPLVRVPETVTLSPPLPGRPAPPPEAAQLITLENGAWYVTAPNVGVLDQLRQLGGLPPDAPLPFPINVSVTIDGQPRVAEKIVWLGGNSTNPVITALTVDGRPMEDSPLALTATGEHALLGAAQGDGVLSYAWYTGFGELKKFLQPAATLEKAEPGQSGALVLVVRDDKGGVTWKMGMLHAQ